MSNSVGPRYVFVGIFMWFSSCVIWMVNTAAKIWVPSLTFLSGVDMAQHWCIAGFEPMQVVGLLVVGWIVLMACVVSRGINKIACITAVGGTVVMCLSLVLSLVNAAILLSAGGHFARDTSFISSSNPGYQSELAMLSSVVFTIFAYGGTEAMGGPIDKIEKLEKNFTRGIVFAAIVISAGYSPAISSWGVSTNWQQVLSNNSVNLRSTTHTLMKSPGMMLGNTLHLPPSTAMVMGVWLTRIIGFLTFLTHTGTFLILSYSLLKAIIQGTPKALWSASMTKLDVVGMLTTIMRLQCLLVRLFILLVSLGGGTASAFYNKLTLMADASVTLLCLLLVLALPFFESHSNLERPFVVFRTRTAALLVVGAVVPVVMSASMFTIIQLVIETGDWNSALWMTGSPVFFSLLAMATHQGYSHRTTNKPERTVE